MPEYDFTFQLTRPTTAFGGMGLKPFSEYSLSNQVVAECQEKVDLVPGIKSFMLAPSALPGSGDFPVEFVIALLTRQKMLSCTQNNYKRQLCKVDSLPFLQR